MLSGMCSINARFSDRIQGHRCKLTRVACPRSGNLGALRRGSIDFHHRHAQLPPEASTQPSHPHQLQSPSAGVLITALAHIKQVLQTTSAQALFATEVPEGTPTHRDSLPTATQQVNAAPSQLPLPLNILPDIPPFPTFTAGAEPSIDIRPLAPLRRAFQDKVSNFSDFPPFDDVKMRPEATNAIDNLPQLPSASRESK